MIINLEKLPDCKALIRIEIPSEDNQAERKQIIKLFSKQAKIPGFRPGKTPANVIEKRFKSEIESEFEDRIVRKAIQKNNDENDIDILSIKEIRDQSHNSDGTYSATIELVVAPDFELTDYKGIEVTVPKIDVTDEQLEESLNQIRERFADYEDVESRGIKMGDFVVINYKGSIEDKPVGEVLPLAPATLAQNTGFWLKMDDNSFLPGFCEPLLDLKENDTKSINVTIPDDYDAEELRGQSLDYEVEIVGIKDTQKTTCTGVEMFRKLLDSGEAGDNVGVLLRGTKREEVERGQVLCKPGSITPHTKFEAEAYILSKDEGGRHTPFFANYRPQFYFRTTDVTGEIILPEGVEMIMRGDNAKMTVQLIAPIAMDEGLRFAIREGGRTVGAGVVAKIVE